MGNDCSGTDGIAVRSAGMNDVAQIQKLIKTESAQASLLVRSLPNLYEHVRDFWVAAGVDGVYGCCALQVAWDDLAEIRSLVVSPAYRGRGLAARLLRACVQDAFRLGLVRIFTLTEIPDFFEKYGFERIDKSTLPHKIWSDCVHCVHFPDCNEVALRLDLTGAAAEPFRTGAEKI